VTLDLPETVTSTLQEARQAHVAVASKHGPHVTPELYAWSGGALWFASGASTVKVNVLRRDPWAAAVVSTQGRSVMVRGPVESFDVRRPDRILRRAGRWPQTLGALGRFSVRNAPDLLAFARDTATGQLGWRVPERRVFLRLQPVAAAAIEGDVVTGGWGGWSSADAIEGADATASAPVGGVAAVVALPGPVAVPGRWFEDEARIRLPSGLFGLLELPDELEVGVVTDEYAAPGPAAKQGRLVRGIARRGEEPETLVVRAARVVDWDGVEMHRPDVAS
jgi:hypothetical protein